uniref:Uncharacterized protein LOC104266093 n=1 Tax=Phallusia mammillata TaxID=59560 RepID=A0A6F9DJP9_9ASCI|nr:uncharacterized protein LOC104266093 [Phallusia mammillata]
MLPCHCVQKYFREIDPEGTATRKSQCFERRKCFVPGPNFCWHVDGYDKLKPYGFCIHGCIDRFSRKIIWLKVLLANNNPLVIGHLYMDAVGAFGGCPQKIRSDCGTENHLASIQCCLMNTVDAHIYGTSPHNQRIKAWWSTLRKRVTTLWMKIFKDLIEQNTYTPVNVLQHECLWHCFTPLLELELDKFKNHWNTHYIRKSRHDTVSGRPNVIFNFPELHGTQNYLKEVDLWQCDYIEQNHFPPEEQERITHQEYFHYLKTELAIACL